MTLAEPELAALALASRDPTLWCAAEASDSAAIAAEFWARVRHP